MAQSSNKTSKNLKTLKSVIDIHILKILSQVNQFSYTETDRQKFVPVIIFLKKHFAKIVEN